MPKRKQPETKTKIKQQKNVFPETHEQCIHWVQNYATRHYLQQLQPQGTKYVKILSKKKLLHNIDYIHINLKVIQHWHKKQQQESINVKLQVKKAHEKQKGFIRDWNLLKDLLLPLSTLYIQIEPCVFYEWENERSGPGCFLIRHYKELKSKNILVQVSIGFQEKIPDRLDGNECALYVKEQRSYKLKYHPKTILKNLSRSFITLTIQEDFTFETLQCPKSESTCNPQSEPSFDVLLWQKHFVAKGTIIKMSALNTFNSHGKREDENFVFKTMFMDDRAIIKFVGRNFVINDCLNNYLILPIIFLINQFFD